jgi:CHAT domain-containing protein
LKRAVVLILGAWIAASPAHAQMQGMRIPTPQEMQQLQRDAAEMQTLMTEMQRLQRLGRYDEAQALGRRLDELMKSGPMSSMMGGVMGGAAEALRHMAPGTLPEGVSAEDLQEATRFSVSDALGMERSMMEGDGAYLPEALFVKPLRMHYVPETLGQAMRVPAAARKHMMDAYQRMGAKDFPGAEASMAQALALSRAPQIIEAAARLHMMRGRNEAALGLLQEAIASAEKANPRDPAIASFLWQQAEAHAQAGAQQRAVEATERALAILSAQGDDTIGYGAGLNNLGVVLHEGGDAARALQSYEKAWEVLQRAMQASAGKQGLESPQMVQHQLPGVGSNIGLARWQLGDAAGAVQAWRAALDARAWFEQASEAFSTERAQLAKAQAVAVELHALMTLDARTLGLQTLLERKGALLERQTRVQTAFRRDASAQVDQPGMVGRFFEGPMARAKREMAEQQRAEDQDLLREYEAVVQERASLAGRPERGRDDLARIADLDTRIQVMQQRMQMHDLQAQNPDPGVSQEEAQRLWRQSGGNQQKFMELMNAREDEQQKSRERKASEARASLVSRVQERVPQGAVLLEMVRYRPTGPRAAQAAERYGSFVIQAGSDAAYVDLGEAAPIDKLAGEFRAALAAPRRAAAARDIGRRLDELLMRPVRARLGSATALYVAPEGSLNLIPLGALVDEKGSYLLERYTINYLASGRDLLHLGRAEKPRGPPTIIADPAFDAAGAAPAKGAAQSRSRDFRALRWDRLPGTADEARTLKRMLPDAAILTGAAATETAAKKVSGPRILHIATHGFFLNDLAGEGEDPMLRSGLVFAGVNALASADDDGVLTALEASSLDLRGTGLVVLSACETGLGEVKNGEGVFGLRRAFAVAGAETLLMSLWQVSDEATRDLMIAYYSRLSRGEPRGEALRQAQLAMLKDEHTRHPFYWAAFISSGEAGRLK